MLLHFLDPAADGGGRLDNQDLIEILDLNGASSKDFLDLPFKPAPNLQGTVLYSRGNVHYF